MPIRVTTELRQRIQTELDVITYAQIRARGGPGSTTLTSIVSGKVETISKGTARKLERAFGWAEGEVAAGVPSEGDPIRSASTRVLLAELLRRVNDENDPTLPGG